MNKFISHGNHTKVPLGCTALGITAKQKQNISLFGLREQMWPDSVYSPCHCITADLPSERRSPIWIRHAAAWLSGKWAPKIATCNFSTALQQNTVNANSGDLWVDSVPSLAFLFENDLESPLSFKKSAQPRPIATSRHFISSLDYCNFYISRVRRKINAAMARERIQSDAGMFAEVSAA